MIGAVTRTADLMPRVEDEDSHPPAPSATRIELPIPRVAQSRHNIALFVQLLINRGQVDRHVRMRILQ